MAVEINDPRNTHSDVAKEDLFLGKDGKITRDTAEATSVFLAAGGPIRPDHRAKAEADGFDLAAEPVERVTADEANAQAKAEEKAKAKPPATKAKTEAPETK